MRRLENPPFFSKEAKSFAQIESYLGYYQEELEQEATLLQNKGESVCDQSFASASFSFDTLKNSDKHLLLLGGMGPQAGIFGMRDALKYTDSLYSITLFQACSIPKRSIGSDITDPLYLSLLNALQCCPKEKEIELIVLCNSAHAFIDTVIQKLDATTSFNIRFHSLKDRIEEQIDMFKEQKSIALQTDFSLKNGVYQEGEYLNTLESTKELQCYQKDLTKAIESIKAFDKKEAIQSAAKLFQGLQEWGAQKILLGCTEIPVLVEYLKEFGDEEMKRYLQKIELVDPLHIALQRLGE